MSEEKSKFVKVTTPSFRVSFPNVHKAKSAFEGQEAVYSIQMLFPKPEKMTPDDQARWKAMKKLCIDVATKKFGPKEKWPKNLRLPFKDGNEKNLENYKDMTVIEARSKMKPGLVDKDLEEITEPGVFYAGCWARATLTCYAYQKLGNAGVSFGLQNIQKQKDDVAFSGKSNAKDDFEVIETDESENDSSSGDDDFDF